jgi:cytochrome c oxidase assembly protein subunit 15
VQQGPRGSDILTVAFGTTVAMWTAGYVCRLPFVQAPPPVLLLLLLLCALGGGFLAGCHAPRLLRAGMLGGLLSGLLNLLVLGGLLTATDQPNRIVPSALLWLPASLLTSALLGLAGAWLGSRFRLPVPGAAAWTAAFAAVAAGATLLLLGVGGLVTSTGAGLAVVDWPNSFRYGMFLYPLSRMTGGIYFEHAHRLFGSLVGLTTAALAFQVARVEPRRTVRGLALLALAMVIVQGILGGLRVTGRFTLSDVPGQTSPQIALAVLHGVLGQVFFAVMVVLATVLRPSWKDAAPVRRRVRPSEAHVGALLVGLLLVQIALGAFQRHLATGVMLHLLLAGVIAPLAVWHGTRAWGLHGDDPTLRRLGLGLSFLTTVQVMLGLCAYVASGAAGVLLVSPAWDVALSTAHQWCGALLLGCAVCLLTWERRLLGFPEPAASELAAQTR